MPDIGTIKNTMGATSDAPDVAENFYDPTVATTLELQNGRLDIDNFDAAKDKLEYRKVKPGTFVQAKMVGCTVNRDVFQNVVPGGATVVCHQSVTADDTTKFIPVPGGNLTFWLPEARDVLFTWMVNAACDAYTGAVTDNAEADEPCAALRFGLDGTFVASQRRAIRGRAYTEYANAGSVFDECYSQNDQRWSGHILVSNVAAGWHTCGLYLGVDSKDQNTVGWTGDPPPLARTDTTGPLQTRIRTTNIKYIAF